MNKPPLVNVRSCEPSIAKLEEASAQGSLDVLLGNAERLDFLIEGLQKEAFQLASQAKQAEVGTVGRAL
jgi:hypothetical protein